MISTARADLYRAWLRERSKIRRLGWPLLILGIVLGVFGWFAVVLELATDPDNLAPAAFLALVGTGLSNLGFFLVMFGLIEDRILQSEAVVLAEMKEQEPKRH